MVRSRPRSSRPLDRVSVFALIVAAIATSTASARDRVSPDESVVEELPRPTRRGFGEVVLEMQPLRQIKSANAPEQAPRFEDSALTPAVGREASSIPETPASADADPRTLGDAAIAPRVEGAPATATAANPASSASGSADATSPTQQAARESDVSPLQTEDEVGEGAPGAAANDIETEEFMTLQASGASALLEVERARENGVETEAPPLRGTDAREPIDLVLVLAPRVDSDRGVVSGPALAEASDRPQQVAQSERAASSAGNAGTADAAGVAPQETDSTSRTVVEAAAAKQAASPSAKKAYGDAPAQEMIGPVDVRLADRATLWLPAGRIFIAREAAKQLFADGPENWDDAKLGVVLPTSRDAGWAALVELVDDGYVKEEGAQELEPERVLAELRRLVAQENGDRQRAGDSPLALTGWVEPPRYDAKRRVSSCVGVTLQGSLNPEDRVVDCTAFALGRQGALKAQIVAPAANLSNFQKEAAAIAAAIVYDHGKSYEDIDPRVDKVAPYDLFGLMNGALSRQQTQPARSANVAPKISLLALIALKALKLWKILAIVAAMAFSAFRWLRGKRKAAPRAPAQTPATQKAGVAAFVPALILAVVTSGRRAASLRGETASRSDDPNPASVGAKAAVLVSKAIAFLKGKLARREGGAREASKQGEPQAQAEAASPASTLSRLAGLMRKQEQSSVAQPRIKNLDSGDFEPTSSAEPKRILPGAGSQTGSDPKPAGASLDLIEPGDRAAASAALSAQQALRRASAA